jgi:hypothetical protein
MAIFTELGGSLLPEVTKGFNWLADVLHEFQVILHKYPILKTIIIEMMKLAAIFGLVLGAVLLLAPVIAGVSAAIGALGTTLGAVVAACAVATGAIYGVYTALMHFHDLAGLVTGSTEFNWGADLGKKFKHFLGWDGAPGHGKGGHTVIIKFPSATNHGTRVIQSHNQRSGSQATHRAAPANVR